MQASLVNLNLDVNLLEESDEKIQEVLDKLEEDLNRIYMDIASVIIDINSGFALSQRQQEVAKKIGLAGMMSAIGLSGISAVLGASAQSSSDFDWDSIFKEKSLSQKIGDFAKNLAGGLMIFAGLTMGYALFSSIRNKKKLIELFDQANQFSEETRKLMSERIKTLIELEKWSRDFMQRFNDFFMKNCRNRIALDDRRLRVLITRLNNFVLRRNKYLHCCELARTYSEIFRSYLEKESFTFKIPMEAVNRMNSNILAGFFDLLMLLSEKPGTVGAIYTEMVGLESINKIKGLILDLTYRGYLFPLNKMNELLKVIQRTKEAHKAEGILLPQDLSTTLKNDLLTGDKSVSDHLLKLTGSFDSSNIVIYNSFAAVINGYNLLSEKLAEREKRGLRVPEVFRSFRKYMEKVVFLRKTVTGENNRSEEQVLCNKENLNEVDMFILRGFVNWYNSCLEYKEWIVKKKANYVFWIPLLYSVVAFFVNWLLLLGTPLLFIALFLYSRRSKRYERKAGIVINCDDKKLEELEQFLNQDSVKFWIEQKPDFGKGLSFKIANFISKF